ncbi:hypothetical protein HPB52_013060 [Rhipicephalus sanguineus]|uniref:Actin-related protein 5 n=1 Tax=Rhipicephalus sanguineus TaxID=34632 RepID=A0A9D4YPE9_RHISA|nr:hypothetical protein HPB52_013060 [Rhipicephalus sanguineus]
MELGCEKHLLSLIMESEVQVGNDIANVEAVRWLLKTQFDRNVVTHFDIQVHFTCSSFKLMKVIGNPSYYRQNMSELLFEHYHVPQVLYGIDALFSLHHNCSKKSENAMVLSFGHHTTHIIPVLNGRVDIENAKRISLGGNNITTYLQRLLQLKHPHLTAAVTLSRAEHLVHQHCYIAENYADELEKWAGVDYFDEHCRQVQLPYNMTSSGSVGSGVGKMDICFNIVKRVQESIAKKKQDTLADDEEKLQQLISIQELLEYEDEATFQESQFSDSELDDADYAEEGEEMEEIIAEFEREFKKAPEILFQPSIIGVEQAGVAETLEFVFSRYTKEQQSFLAQNVFVTGSPAQLPGVRERLCAELLAMRPFQSLFSVTLAMTVFFEELVSAGFGFCQK